MLALWHPYVIDLLLFFFSPIAFLQRTDGDRSTLVMSSKYVPLPPTSDLDDSPSDRNLRIVM